MELLPLDNTDNALDSPLEVEDFEILLYLLNGLELESNEFLVWFLFVMLLLFFYFTFVLGIIVFI